MFKVILALLIFGALTSCNYSSKDQFNLAPPPQQNPPPGGEVQQQDLRGKSFNDVMALKYNRAEIVCSLWTMLSSELDLERAPNATRRINLKDPFKLPLQFNLIGAFRGFGQNQFLEVHQINASIVIYKIPIRESFSIEIPELQTRYNYLYSPEVGFSTHATIRSYTPSGEIIQTYPRPETLMHEKIQTEVINFESEVIPNEFGFKTRDYVKCEIETEIRPEYEHQYSVETVFPQ